VQFIKSVSWPKVGRPQFCGVGKTFKFFAIRLGASQIVIDVTWCDGEKFSKPLPSYFDNRPDAAEPACRVIASMISRTSEG
jgi:hypothetical protein